MTIEDEMRNKNLFIFDSFMETSFILLIFVKKD